MQKLKIYILPLLIFLISSCSALYGAGENSEGDQSISDSPTVITFESAVDTTIYKTIKFTNRSEENYEITNMAFVDNDCGAFSVHTITDSSGNILYGAGDSVSVSVNADISVDINIRFSPTACEITEYMTTFMIYYGNSDSSKVNSVSLQAIVDDSTPDSVSCDDEDVQYYDEFDNPTERTLPVLDNGEKYYLKVNQMNAYLQATGGFASFSTAFGTHYNVADVPEDEAYTPAYLAFTTDADGDAIIDIVDTCTGFSLPTNTTDPYFLGARVNILTDMETLATIDRTDDDAGKLVIQNFKFKLSSFINNSSSLLQSSDGYFEVNVLVALTTGETEENEFLPELIDLKDDNDETFLNITSDDTMTGKNIRHGTVTLVGIGQFLDDDDVKMDDVGVQALIENESYIFIQIVGEITQIEE